MSPVVVDLVTPPSSPDLPPADGDADGIPPIKSEKRAAVHPPDCDAEDDEVVEVQHPSAKSRLMLLLAPRARLRTTSA